MRTRSLFLQARMTYCMLQTKTHDSGSLHHIDKISYTSPLWDLSCAHIYWTKAVRYSRDQRSEMLACKIHRRKKSYVSHSELCFPLSRTRSSAHSTYSYFLSWLVLSRLILLLKNTTFLRKVCEFLQQHTRSHSRLKFPSYSLLQ